MQVNNLLMNKKFVQSVTLHLIISYFVYFSSSYKFSKIKYMLLLWLKHNTKYVKIQK